jgi:hypothetical protein
LRRPRANYTDLYLTTELGLTEWDEQPLFGIFSIKRFWWQIQVKNEKPDDVRVVEC